MNLFCYFGNHGIGIGMLGGGRWHQIAEIGGIFCSISPSILFYDANKLEYC
jgi:hypothetical protein